MREKENQNWKEISKDIADVTKKVKDSVDDENLVDDLKSYVRYTELRHTMDID